MKAELQQKFYDRWPVWFSGRNEGMHVNLMCFGFEHDDGWFDLEWRLCEDLEKILGENTNAYKLFQVKEKFGQLRWYYQFVGNLDESLLVADPVWDRVRQAMTESSQTCERCGKPGELRSNGNWLKTLCAECAGPFKPFSQEEKD
jgi:hypothetical protein